MGPNPFRVAISFDLAIGRDLPVDLSILDLSGRRIRRLVAQPAEQGDRRFSWDGCDGAGRAAPGGIYLAVLSSSGRRLGTWRVTRVR